jgi:hypothetical protein
MGHKRNSTASLFMRFGSLEGWRHVEVTDHHTALDYAQNLEGGEDRVGADNLNIHTPASLWQAFPAAEAEARCLVERFAWHYTLKHGS